MDTGRNKLDSFALFIALWLGVMLCIFFVLSDYGSTHTYRRILLDEKVNPNEAPPASLVRLPGIGIGRAAEIVSYREQHAQGDAELPFKSCDDMLRVKGLGPKTVQNIKKWLTFQKSEQDSTNRKQN